MENKNLQGKISKLIKIQPNSQKYTLFTKIPNIPINQIKTKEKIINYSPPQKIEKEKNTKLFTKNNINILLKSSSETKMKEPLKFSPNKIKIKGALNLTNINLSYLNNIKSESFHNKISNIVNNISLTERKIRSNKLNIIDDKTKQIITKKLEWEKKDKIEKKEEIENKSNSQNKTKKRNNINTYSIPKLPIHTLETVKENEGISPSTTSKFEKNNISMLQQYFDNLKKKQLSNTSNIIISKKKIKPISYSNLFKNESNNCKKIINKSYGKNKSVEKYCGGKLNMNNNKSLINYSNFEESVNIEDLIILEGKFEIIEEFIYEKKYYLLNKTCFEWLNFYFNSSLKGNLNQFFIDKKVKKIIEETNILTLISIIIIYELSYNKEFFESNVKLIASMLQLDNKNYLLICNNFLSKIKKEFLNSIWVERLRSITLNRVNNREYYISQIDKNTDEIYDNITKIISSVKNYHILNQKIIEIINNYSNYTHEKIYKIFLSNILKLRNENGSKLYSNLKSSPPIIKVPLKSNPIKPLSLFLDLDETLISFVFSKENEGISRLRPYLYQFLNTVKNYFELIIFTTSTKNYADPILDVIEVTKGKYFSYRLYRESCTIVNNYIIKDIEKFGRDLNKCIIVDNIPQNFKLQKENGILISSFWGEDINDKALINLGRILVTIAVEMIDNNYTIDIRNLLMKYRDDILKKVSIK